MLSVAKNPKAYMTYALQEHKERRLPSLAGKQVQDTFLSKTPKNRRLRQKHQRRRVLEKSKNKNRLETYKQRETAAPVHVKERERGGVLHYRHFGNKGGVEKGKVRPTGSGSAKAAKGKDRIKET